MNLNQRTLQLKEFRQGVYDVFEHCADTLMNLIDALSSNRNARSVVELSLNPAFERGYSALFKGIIGFHQARSPKEGRQEATSEPASKPKTRVDIEVNDSREVAKSSIPEGQEAQSKVLEGQEGSSLVPFCQKMSPQAPEGPQAPEESVMSSQAPEEPVMSSQAPEGPQALESPVMSSQAPEPTDKSSQAAEDTDKSPQAAEATHKSPQAAEATHKSPQAPEGPAEGPPRQAPEGPARQAPEGKEEAQSDPLIDARQARIEQEHKLLKLIVPYLPAPKKRPFWLFGVDVTSQPRQFASTLKDRGFVYQSNSIKGNKPVTIGHQYSLMAYLPEKTPTFTPPWIVPLSTRRVATNQDKELVGAEQMTLLMNDESFPFHKQLCVQVADSTYSKRAFLHATHAAQEHENLLTIARVRSDRTFFRKYEPLPNEPPKQGHPTWYGERFSLKEPLTWHTPLQTAQTEYLSRRGKQYMVQISAWHNMLMKGKQGIPMHKYPFTLVQIRSFNANGEPAFKNTLWLIVVGKRREELDLLDIYEAYRQRYDLEHYFRFGKQKLLMTAFQTPEVEREENWWQIVQLAYTQLWLAQSLALEMPRPWEKYLPKPEGQMPSPSTVQRDFGRIIRQLGTPANPPKVRHKGAGRAKGKTFPPRQRPKVIKKGKKSQDKEVASPQN